MLLFILVTPIFYFVVAAITAGKIAENYLHSPECKGCRNDR